MEATNIKIKLKGHESFYFREGWLRKGIKNIEIDEKVFLNENATDILGVGSNMVKSIRYWLQACGLTEEKVGAGGKRYQCLTNDFGRIINEYDPYFEDIFTLWLLHYKIASNKELCTSWYLFFNDFNAEEFSKEDMFESMKISLNKLVKGAAFSEKSLQDDCSCIIKTYYLDEKDSKNPEENTICPLVDLNIIGKKVKSSGKEIFIKQKPHMDKLDKLIILYIMLDNIEDSESTSINKLIEQSGNIGKVLNLDRNMINEYLDKLKNEGYIEVNRAAGLDKVYIKTKSKEEILTEYYSQL